MESSLAVTIGALKPFDQTYLMSSIIVYFTMRKCVFPYQPIVTFLAFETNQFAFEITFIQAGLGYSVVGLSHDKADQPCRRQDCK